MMGVLTSLRRNVTHRLPHAAMHPPGLLTLCVAVTCALQPACKRHAVDPGPDLQIVDETVHLRSDDPVPKTSPYFDGSVAHFEAARGETIGFLVYHRLPASLHLAGDVPVRAYSVERVRARRGSTNLYGGGGGAGDYPDVLAPSDAPATNPAYFEIAVAHDTAPGEHTLKLAIGTQT